MIQKIYIYKIVKESTLIKLQKTVQLRIDEGWIPQGGVSSMMIEQGLFSGVRGLREYSQAMVWMD